MSNPLPRGPLELPKRHRPRPTASSAFPLPGVVEDATAPESHADPDDTATPSEITSAVIADEAHGPSEPVYVSVVIEQVVPSTALAIDLLRDSWASGSALAAQTDDHLGRALPADLLADESSEPSQHAGHPGDAGNARHPDEDRIAAIRHWLSQLAFMEQTLDQMDSILGRGAIPVVPEMTSLEPVPVPDQLIPRARMVMERQIAVAEEINRRIRSTEAEMALTKKVRENALVDSPVFLDTTA